MPEQPKPKHVPDLAALSAYLDGELDANETRTVAVHLAACPACAARVAELQALSAGFRALPEESLGFDLAGVVEGRLADTRRPPAQPRRVGWMGWPLAAGAAASIVAGVVMGSMLVAGGAATAPRMAALSVFDTIPPGNLCIGLDSCYAKGNPK